MLTIAIYVKSLPLMLSNIITININDSPTYQW